MFSRLFQRFESFSFLNRFPAMLCVTVTRQNCQKVILPKLGVFSTLTPETLETSVKCLFAFFSHTSKVSVKLGSIFKLNNCISLTFLP